MKTATARTDILQLQVDIDILDHITTEQTGWSSDSFCAVVYVLHTGISMGWQNQQRVAYESGLCSTATQSQLHSFDLEWMLLS